MKKKIFALMLALCMVLGMTNITAYAATGDVDEPAVFTGETAEIVIPAGGSYYYNYNPYGFNGQTVVISGDGIWDATVEYGGGILYPYPNGELHIALSNMYYEFIIKNSNTTDAITLNVGMLASDAGTMDNPEVLDPFNCFGGDVSLEEGDEDGYWYEYTAPTTGVIAFFGIGEDVELSATNNSNSKMVVWSEDKDVDTYGDEYMNLSVKEGDLVRIQVAAIPEVPENGPWVYPAVNVSWSASLEGDSEYNPIYLYDDTYTFDVYNDEEYYISNEVLDADDVSSVTVKGENAYIVVGEDTKEAENGVVTYEFTEGNSSGFIVGNATESTGSIIDYKSYEVTINYAEGTSNNPAELKDGKNTADLEEGEIYNYTWTAPADGKVTFTVDGTNGWAYAIIAGVEEPEFMEAYASSGEYYYADENKEESGKKDPVPSVTYDVKKGEIFVLTVSTYELDEETEEYYGPAGTVNVTVDFAVDYAITAGDNQEWKADDEGNITITADGNYADFVGIKVDGKDVEAKNYEVKEGSTIVTLKADYLATLAAGKHTVTFVYKYGTVDASITTTPTTATTVKPVPPTGDTANAILWISILGLGVVAIAGSVVMRKREF